MTAYVFRDGKLVEKSAVVSHSYQRSDFPVPYMISDIADYYSVASGKVVSGRADRREDLKRTGCREVDPSEAPKGYNNPKYERRYSKNARKLAR